VKERREGKMMDGGKEGGTDVQRGRMKRKEKED
jgi:hypothetical protein